MALKEGTIVRYKDTLQDPEFPLVGLILWMFSSDTFIAFEMAKATRDRDASKISTLGPFAMALFRIIEAASYNR